jgi:hypothetical protein
MADMSICWLREFARCFNIQLNATFEIRTHILTSELLGFWVLSTVWYSRKLDNKKFQKLALFPFSGERGEAPTLLGPFRVALFK